MRPPAPPHLLPGERVLWQGAPAWRALLHSQLHVRFVALYFGAVLLLRLASDRAAGLPPWRTFGQELPFVGISLVLLAALALFAWLQARTTRYTLTDRRCVMRYGIALPATLSLPLTRVGAVAITVRADHCGDIPLALKPGARVAFHKLWPNARPWKFAQAQPMLRAVPQAAVVAGVLSRAVAAAQAEPAPVMELAAD